MSQPRSLWAAAQPLVLASSSSVRRAMLTAAGIPLEVDPAGIDERQAENGQAPKEVAAHLAREKARVVSRRHPERLVLGADQTLALNEKLLHKPSSAEAAQRQLAALQGREHRLHSAAALARNDRIVAEVIASATLLMRRLDEHYISRYVAAAGEAAITSVGGYQLEGLGVHLFEHVEGDHFTILGLPLLGVLAALRAEGCLAG